jgi:hypothetical protein
MLDPAENDLADPSRRASRRKLAFLEKVVNIDSGPSTSPASGKSAMLPA